MAIGARAQSARTYLERRMDEVLACGALDELVLHALRALRDTLPNELSLSDKVSACRLPPNFQSHRTFPLGEFFTIRT